MPAPTVGEDAIRNAAEGAMLGALVGDAAGATLEFKAEVSPPLLETALAMRGGGVWKTAPGQITDDGELSMTLATALVEGKAEFDADLLAQMYSKWVDSRPFDIGNTTKKALGIALTKKAGSANAMRIAAKAHCAQSQSNGSLMRCTPVAVYSHRFSQEEVIEMCNAECTITHSNPTIIDAYTCYILAIVHLIRHPKDRKGAWHSVQSWAHKSADKETREWLKAAEDGTKVPFSPNIGWAKIGFVHAFQHLLKGSSYLDAIRETLRGGGDTDTNGAIVGGLIGAAVGASDIPKEMKDAVLRCDITAGDQMNRPAWLQTAASFRRVFASLYDFAPSKLQFAQSIASPSTSPRSSPKRALSPPRSHPARKVETLAAIANVSKDPSPGRPGRGDPPSPKAIDQSSPPARIASPALQSRSRTNTGESRPGWSSAQLPTSGSSKLGHGAPVEGAPLRVLSWCVAAQSKVNDLGYAPAELRDWRLAAQVAALQPDIAGFQEIEDVIWMELRTLLEDYDSHFAPQSGQREGLCVFWRKQRCAMVSTGALSLAQGQTNSSAALFTGKDLENSGEEVCFVSAQLTTDPKKESLKSEELKVLLGHLSTNVTCPRLIVGVSIDSAPGTSLYDSFQQAHFVSAYVDCGKQEVQCTVHTDKTKKASEYLFFLPKQLRTIPKSARQYATDKPIPNVLWPSSHLPVVCDFASFGIKP